jgi:hypothetical protein
VGPKAGLDRCGKSRPPPGFDPQTIQPVASHYSDYATRPQYVLELTTQMLPSNSNNTAKNNDIICRYTTFIISDPKQLHILAELGSHNRSVCIRECKKKIIQL